MKENQKTELLNKYNEGLATPEEQAIVESWQLQFPLEGRHVLGDKETKADLAEIRTNLLRISGKGNTRLLWYKISAVAAVALIAFSTGLYFYPRTNTNGKTVAELAKHDILPGRNTATLTLANGTKIVLAESVKGKLATESGISITKDADGQIVYQVDDVSGAVSANKQTYNTLSTAKGEQYQVNLPDGTKVWLNAASSLTYAPSFSGKAERRVQLNGEAYFEVAKDKLHPFIVKTQDQEVKVLGTHFNVNSYQDESTEKTTLLEGSVNVNNKAVLQPGQQSVVSDAGNVRVQQADLDGAVAWKNGYFQFNDVPLQTIMRQISRWYDIEVIYKGTLTNDAFNGTIDRKASLSRILKILEKGGVKFSIEGKELTVFQ